MYKNNVSRRASMCCSYAMMSSKFTSLEEEEGVDMDGAERDVAKWEARAAKFDCLDRN